MDIYSNPGTKVIFTGEGGYESDKEFGHQHLAVNNVYTVKDIKVGDWISYVELEEVLGKRFNTALFKEAETSEDPKKKFWEVQEQFSKQMQEIAEKYERDCDEYWDKLSYEDKLKAFYSVCKRIYKADVVNQGSYRHALYTVFGFGADAYVIGMECNYIDIHNYIQDGVASHKEYVKKNGNMQEDL